MNEKRTWKDLKFFTRSAKDGKGNVAIGYAAVFNSPTNIAGMFDEVIEPGAFKRAIQKNKDVCCLVNHNWEKIIGRTKSGTLKLEEDAHGLKFEVDIPDTTDGNDLVELMNRGDINQCSFGFSIIDESWDYSVTPALRTIKKVELFEVSIVTLPAYEDTQVSLRSGNFENMGGSYAMRQIYQQNTEVRKKLGQWLAGRIGTDEVRTLGLDINGGRAFLPTVVGNEIIGYVEEENLLRKFGTVVPVDEKLRYPVLLETSDIKVSINATERTEEIPVNKIDLAAVLLDPAEFSTITRISKRLVSQSIQAADLILGAVKKEYVKKEMDYMFNGQQGETYNTGSLYNKAAIFEPTDGTDQNKAFRELSKKTSTAVRKNARWFVNDAALEIAEIITLPNGEAALKTIENTEGGVKYTFFGYPLHCLDVIKGADDSKAVFYFGDMASFVIQDNSNGLEIETLTEKYATENEVGYKLYNLLDGKLVYSELDPTVYIYEI